MPKWLVRKKSSLSIFLDEAETVIDAPPEETRRPTSTLTSLLDEAEAVLSTAMTAEECETLEDQNQMHRMSSWQLQPKVMILREEDTPPLYKCPSWISAAATHKP